MLEYKCISTEKGTLSLLGNQCPWPPSIVYATCGGLISKLRQMTCIVKGYVYQKAFSNWWGFPVFESKRIATLFLNLSFLLLYNHTHKLTYCSSSDNYLFLGYYYIILSSLLVSKLSLHPNMVSREIFLKHCSLCHTLPQNLLTVSCCIH